MFKDSPQQAAFYSWIKDGNGSCVLEAVAGAGKTTTLIRSLELMKGLIFFGAYNKKIADEIIGRAAKRFGLNISTMHSAGFSAWRSFARGVKVDANKVALIFDQAAVRTPAYKPFKGVVLNLVSLAKQAGFGIAGMPDMMKKSSWTDLIEHFDIDTLSESDGEDFSELIIKLSIKTLKLSIDQDSIVIDFDDMIYSPLYHGCSMPQYDWVLVDEAQDTNATRRLLALKMLKPHGRLVAVGDRHQAIYGFTGADSDALDLIEQATSATRLPLTITFRCPKAVVTYARTWVKHIEAAESAPEGEVQHLDVADLYKEAKVGDAILCRFNAPLLEHVYKFIAAGVPAKIEGREIGKGLITLAKRWKVKSLAELLDHVEEYCEREVAKFTALEQGTKASGVEDKCTCLKVIIERVIAKNVISDPVAAVIVEVEAIFSDDPKDKYNVILLSSIHKSKGREWNRVIWLQTGPSKFATLQWMVEQEDNLCYVAATRAKQKLMLVNIQK